MVRVRKAVTSALVALGSGAAPAALIASPAHAQDVPADPGDPGVAGDDYTDTDPSAFTDFRPTLDPHGTWVDDPTYGAVWTPNQDEVGSDFVPYDTAGQWDYADGDYSWYSYYEWGWVCFHYGRWVYGGAQWLWVPGRQYAGAWVTWRISSDSAYVGWAPTAPTWGWTPGGTVVGLGFNAPEPWAFTGASNLFGPGLASRVVTGRGAASIGSNSRPYVRATPTVAGHSAQLAATHGPPPALLAIDPAQIAHPPVSTRELRARQFARPTTAQAMGGRAPAPRVSRPASAGPAAAPRAGRAHR